MWGFNSVAFYLIKQLEFVLGLYTDGLKDHFNVLADDVVCQYRKHREPLPREQFPGVYKSSEPVIPIIPPILFFISDARVFQHISRHFVASRGSMRIFPLLYPDNIQKMLEAQIVLEIAIKDSNNDEEEEEKEEDRVNGEGGKRMQVENQSAGDVKEINWNPMKKLFLGEY